MEENILKRANEKGKKYARQYHHNTCTEVSEPFVYSNDEIELACIEMATEQKVIDIDKAWKWIEYALDNDEFITEKRFKEAMEEYICLKQR